VGTRVSAEAVIWHDLECGGYRADLGHWHALAADCAGPLLDVGAGTGRVALSLAGRGHAVIALERDPVLADELERRAAGLAVQVICGDATSFTLAAPVSLAIVPMQTIHLLDDRAAFLRCARRALASDGVLAVSLLGEGVEPFELELEPDAVRHGAVRYESTPTALRRCGGAIVLERRRTRSSGARAHSQTDRISLRECERATLEREARTAGFRPAGVRSVAPTLEHAGSEIVCLAVAP
jgi:SAM-dependent methyltransferase